MSNTNNTPKRVTPAKNSKAKSKSQNTGTGPLFTNKDNVSDTVSFELPKAKLDLEFFLKRGTLKYTPDQVIEEIFGEEGFKMTENEKVYSVLKALEDLELAMPFEFTCEHCGTANPIAVEVAKVMKTDGEPKSQFTIEFDNYIFKFDRPEKVQDTLSEDAGLAGIGMYMMQWLVGHNQGPNFEFIHLKIGTIIKLAKLFSMNMFTTEFTVESKCAKCGGQIKEEFGVSMQDLTTLINEL